MPDECDNGGILHYRVDQLEAFRREVTQELRSLRSAINELHMSVRSKPECPDPGRCVSLQKEVNAAMEEVAKIKRWQAGVEKKVAWLLGAVAVATPIGTFLLPKLWALLVNGGS